MRNSQRRFFVWSAAVVFCIAFHAFGQETTPSATLTITDALPDTHALLPLQNWSPLFDIQMGYSTVDTPAPRVLDYLDYEIIPDPNAGDRPYAPVITPQYYHFLEFALLRNFGTDDSPQWRVLYVWNNQGAPLGTRTGLRYRINFRANGYPVPNADSLVLPDPAQITYRVAFRTSARWHSGLGFAYRVHEARMFPYPLSGDPPQPVDSYSPNFFGAPPEILDPGTAYSSSFSVYDVTATLGGEQAQPYTNSWNWTSFLYAPLPEFARPRWDQGNLFETFPVTYQRMELRRLFSIETWTGVVGINIHATDQSWLETQSRRNPLGAVAATGSPNAQQGLPMRRIGQPIIREVSVVATDEGADPLGFPGNGGFNPSEGLDFQSFAVSSGAGEGPNPDGAIRHDHAFNGLWLWNDTNNDYAFNRPTPDAGGNGVTFNDHPALPPGVTMPRDLPDPVFGNEYEFSQAYPDELYFWEWVPFPPSTQSPYPWWRIKLPLSEMRSNDYGRIEPTPDGDKEQDSNDYYPDYFITIRPDSGYADSSTDPGDGTGITLGADTKIFIEPRDPANPARGGLLATCQIPLENVLINRQPWEADPRWNNMADGNTWTEPWWPERSQNWTNTKAVRCGAEVHDLVLTYDSDSDFATGSGYNYLTDFPAWMDAFDDRANTFYDGYSVGVRLSGTAPDGLNIQQPYESVPFFSEFDTPPFGPRSYWYTTPPPQPNRPRYATWPLGNNAANPSGNRLPLGRYPQEKDWPLSERAARKLVQRIDGESAYPTAMLGFNFCGANDPRTAQYQRLVVKQITVAFWGPDLNGDGTPDFVPSDLKPLDPKGLAATSGVALFNDNGDGVFDTKESRLELIGLAWQSAPEYVDLDGDFVADDLSGDGVVNALDKAWVLRLTLRNDWRPPAEDASGAAFGGGTGGGTGGTGGGGTTEGGAKSAATAAGDIYPVVKGDASIKGDNAVLSEPQKGSSLPHMESVLIDPQEAFAPKTLTKAVGDQEAAGNAGDDMFLAVLTSDTIARFRKFKAFVPAWLPERTGYDRQGGVQFDPLTVPSTRAYEKHHPEENVGKSFFEHELLETNVPTRVTPVTQGALTLPNDGRATAVLGIDISTNRGVAAVAASGTGGVGTPGSFTVTGTSWTPGAFVGYFLVDSAYESYEITANTANTLTLRSGTPRSGAWRIVKDPTFLEQLIVELYPETTTRRFNIQTDLKQLDIDPTVSGVALYRDNDNAPGNRNGVFDPDIDLPVALDYPPFLTGQQGEPPIQVMFVFSTPGTDNVPVPLANQPRHRQIVPDSFGGNNTSDPDYGSDFFVVLRASGPAANGVAFRAAIVSWGPSTPTEPDPDTFPPPPLGQNGEFDLFSEFPWGYRALGYITFFKNIANYDPLDSSGYNWVRSTCGVTAQTGTITINQVSTGGGGGGGGGGTPGVVSITSVNPNVLPSTIPSGGVQLTISGNNFGTSPTVVINGVPLTIVSATNTQIVAAIPGGTVLVEPVTLTVTNPTTPSSANWTGITLVSESEWLNRPVITAITPSQGSESNFPVTITGLRFNNPTVTFGSTTMPVAEWTPTRIVVAYPISGIATTGFLDVRVTNDNGLYDIKFQGFCFISLPGGGAGVAPCFIATAAYGTPFERHLDTFRAFRDGVLLKSAWGTALVKAYYRFSPPVADAVAAHPALGTVVRGVLTPVAFGLEHPTGLMVLLLGGMLSGGIIYKRARYVKERRVL